MEKEKMIPVKWLQKRMAEAITENKYSDEHLDSKYFLLINKFIAEYEEEQNALERREQGREESL